MNRYNKTKQQTECEEAFERFKQLFEASKKSNCRKMKDDADDLVEWLNNVLGMKNEDK